MHTFLQDLRFGVRMLAKARGFTLVATLVLALGIGSTTAVFGLVEMVVFIVTVFIAYAYVWRRGGLEWDFSRLHPMPIEPEFTRLVHAYLASVLSSPSERKGFFVVFTLVPRTGRLQGGLNSITFNIHNHLIFLGLTGF